MISVGFVSMTVAVGSLYEVHIIKQCVLDFFEHIPKTYNPLINHKTIYGI